MWNIFSFNIVLLFFCIFFSTNIFFGSTTFLIHFLFCIFSGPHNNISSTNKLTYSTVKLVLQAFFALTRLGIQHFVMSQYGHTAFFARTGKVTCPVAVTERLIKLLLQSSSSFTLVHRTVKSLRSISILREEFKRHIKLFVSDISKYSTHSMKSNAASNPACRKIAGDFSVRYSCWLEVRIH